jgi:Uma2 family endonuclease
MSTATKTHYTPQDLLELPDAVSWELVDGQLVERTMSELSSYIGGRLVHFLMAYCEPAGLGWVFPADAGYQCFPDAPNKVRKPDASFIRRERLPEGPHARGFTRIAPDLAVEVLSPHEYATDVETKLQEYLDAGVQLVWKVNPEARLVTVLRVDGTGNRLREDDELSGENIIPGFRMKVGDLFLPLPQPASE